MADLQKLFVLVSAANTAAFKSTYVTGESRNTAYDNKIVFLEGTGEIFTKGKLYGMSNDQAAQLSKAIASVGLNADGTLPAWAAGADSIKDAKSIIAAVVALDAKAKALQAELDAEQAKVAASKTLTDAYEFSGSIKYVAAKDGVAAHIALVDETGTTELSKVEVSDIIGNGVLESSSYDKTTGILKLTFAQADGSTNVVDVNLADMLDINDVQIDADSQKYMGVNLDGAENSQAIFSIKVSKMADQELTGLADAKDVKTYIDGKVAGKNVSAEGDTYVTATAADNKVTVAAQIGNMVFTAAQGGNAAKLEGVEGKLVDSKEAATAIKGYADAVVAKEAADRATAITDAIEALDIPAVEKGNNVKVKISEADGKVALESVVESYATVNYTAHGDSQNTSISVKTGDEGKLIKASDLANVAGYAAGKVTEEAARVDAKIAALAGDKSGSAAGVSTQVTTAAGEVSGVVVTVADNAVVAGGTKKDGRTLTVGSTTNVIKGSAIAEIKKYVDNVVSDNTADLTVKAQGDEYITASVPADDNKKINIIADVTTLTIGTGDNGDSTLTGTAKSLVDASDVAGKVSSFVNARIGEEIAKLDVDPTTAGTGNVTVTYSETDGKVSISDVAVKTATVTYTPASGENAASLSVTAETQLATGAHINAVKNYVNAAVAALDSTVVEKDASEFVTVTTAIADGKLNADASSVAVVYAAHTPGKYTNGVATGAFVNEVLGDLWETYAPVQG